MTDYRVTILETSDEEVEFAIGWHSGQSSPLYSVASCGNFVRGEHIPYPHENCAEYEVSLLWDLLIELKDCDPWQDSQDAETKAAWMEKIGVEIRRREFAMEVA